MPSPRSSPRSNASVGVSRRMESFTTTTTRVLGGLCLFCVFLFYKDWDLSGTMVDDLEKTAVTKRNATATNGTAATPASSSPPTTGPLPGMPSLAPITTIASSEHEAKTSHTSSIGNNGIQQHRIDDIDPFAEQPGCSLLKELVRNEPTSTRTTRTTTTNILSMRGILEEFGSYVPVTSGTADDAVYGPRYDHRSCFLMRPRYNCARNRNTTTTIPTNPSASATDFALILQGSTNPSRSSHTPSNHGSSNTNATDHDSSRFVCDLQKFVHDAGGPAGVGLRMLQNHHQPQTDRKLRRNKGKHKGKHKGKIRDKNKDEESSSSSSPLIEVLLVGTSRFRQIFEALVCGFSDQLTHLQLQLGGPVFNVRHKYMDAEQMGPLVDLEFVKNGSCYEPQAQPAYEAFFRADGTIVPENHDKCNDNIAMAEFRLDHPIEEDGNNTATIRFYYVFRPWAWTNVTPALASLGIQPKHKLDFVLWEPRDVADAASWQYAGGSDDLESLYATLFDIRSKTRIPSHPSNNNNSSNPHNNKMMEQHDAHELYKAIQLRDIGRYFGADNPWITHPPDQEHPCMPGMPDDKVNFLLWYMLSLSTL